MSDRPGARFGRAHVRVASELLRRFNKVQNIEPFAVQQVVDAGDIACKPFDIGEAIRRIDQARTRDIDRGAREIVCTGAKLMTIGGDHTIVLPLGAGRAGAAPGPIAAVPFNAHLNTWDT